MEKHIHKELVVVKSDAICYPWTVMVHFKDASVALRAVMTPIRLSFIAPLANTDTSITFTLNRGVDFHDGSSSSATLVSACTCLLIVLFTILSNQWSLSCLKILEILVNDLSGFSLLLFNKFVGKLLA